MSEPALTLFADCPACRRNPVPDPREPCQECVTAFGPMIRAPQAGQRRRQRDQAGREGGR